MRKLNTKGSDIFVDILIVKPRIKNIGTQATEVHTKGKDTELHLTVVLYEHIKLPKTRYKYAYPKNDIIWGL